MLFAAAATAFASCSKDQTESTPEPPKEKVTIRFTASNDNDTDSEKKAQSRTEFGEGYTIKWTNTDIIGVYINSTLATENAEATAERDQTGVYFMATVNDFAAGDVLTAYYPRAASNASNPAVAEVSIPAEQAQSAVKVFNGQTNPLVAVPFTLASPDNAILEQIKFRQLGAMAEFDIFSEGADWEGEIIRSVSFTNNGDANLAGSFTYDLTAVTELGTPAAIDPTTLTGGSKSVTVSLPAESTAAVSANQAANILYMTLIPGTYTGDLVVTTDKATYTYANRTVDFQRAYVKRFLLDLNRAERKATASAGNKAVINIASLEAGNVKLGTNSYLKTLTSWLQDEVEYSVNYVTKNAKNGTSGIEVAANQFLQFQKDNGVIYNNTAQPIKRIDIYVLPQYNGVTVETGAISTKLQAVTPENSQTTVPLLSNLDKQKDQLLDVFTITSTDAKFFKITAATTLWIYKIEIAYGEPLPALPTPQITSASANGNTVVIEWNAVEGAADYTVKCGTETLAGVTANTATFTMDYEKTYDISVVANPTDTENFRSSAAATTTVTTGENPNPAIVSVDPASVVFEAAGGSQTIAVTVKNQGDNVIVASGLTAPFEATVNGTTVTVTAPENTGAAIEQILTLTLVDSTIEIPVTQAAAGGSTDPEKTLTFSFTKNVSGWPTSTKAGSYSYSLDGSSYTFLLSANVYCSGSYLMVKSGASLGLPAIPGYKLTKVVGTLNPGGTPSVKSEISIAANTSGSQIVTGGEAQVWNKKGGQYTYNLSGTAANTTYYMCVSKANSQYTQVVLTYTAN